MKNKIDFFRHPASGMAILAILAVLITFTVVPWDNNMDNLDENDFMIVNAHENIESIYQADKLLEVMDATNVARTVLVGSPEEILHFNGEQGFTNPGKNNEVILSIANKYDNRFYAFCTIDPADPDKLAEMESCMSRGGDGIKLYNGHAFFYEYPLDDEKMLGVYRTAEEQGFPVIMHVNTGYYLDQFENVMTLYPDMTVICPHFCLSSKNLPQLTALLDTYPNLYVDISFGYTDYLKDGLARISENIDSFRTLFESYPDRFVFGTVAVVTEDDEYKSADWLTETYKTYRDLLEQETYTTFHVVDAETGEETELSGLNLDDELLKQIYETNWAKILGSS
ncbi:hypothetical protein COW94_04770 [Candidatus Peregrinibacteria bacterium CG22_combo_CG10-13_8_21_14_all_44_10]|nr:MAG: hypothetical protein AUK45_03140 [Candidatus Peregrinibacteria bacterium CG2_30_44_17]PIP65889.1 MAG: hypothetical protein COW94_04770 [Candidatus Peregrinibacteria bacterium CG22_combo_CG10-13_8_21_14_all_44_10]PIS04299.1 MAG: hypothetical protein COT83_01350 [Candidatus Peregrinibacteria bacterium CG10_big_fil_rev_8_21_14_0_10_44_7]PIX80211.1 MAG: hypothetical protein COZ35_01525 [Candidatus Peregrinibacteria bacterium CG_4_10_14_3_um_filter_44_21]